MDKPGVDAGHTSPKGMNDWKKAVLVNPGAPKPTNDGVPLDKGYKVVTAQGNSPQAKPQSTGQA